MSPRRTLVRLAVSFALLHAAIAVATYEAIRVAARSGWPVVGRVYPLLMFSDVPGYFNNASKLAAGEVPYRDHLVEYPPLALPFLYAPRLVTDQQRLFVVGFAAEMLLVNAAIVAMVAARVTREQGLASVSGRLWWYTACFAAVCPFAVGRFDLVPAAFAFAAAGLWFSRREGLGGVVAGLGVLVKIMPGAIAVPGLAWDLSRLRETRGKGVVSCALTVLLGAAGWFAVGGAGAVGSIRYHTERGIELGTVYSGAALAAARLTGSPLALAHNHASDHLVSPWSEAAATIAFPAQIVALALVAWRFRATGFRDPTRFAGASVLAFVVAGKVFSPQYMLWVLPFVASQRDPVGRPCRFLFLAASLATMIVYPWAYDAFIRLETAPFVVLNARNALLIVLFGWMLFAPERPGPVPSAVGRGPLRRGVAAEGRSHSPQPM